MLTMTLLCRVPSMILHFLQQIPMRLRILRLIYAVNQPAVRDSIQSAFTNVNFFDTPYLVALFGGKEFPDGKPMIDELDGMTGGFAI